MAWCGLWRVEGVSPCIDIRIGGIGWNYGGSLIGYKTTKKKLKVKQSRQTRVCLRFTLQKQAMRYRPMAGLVGCVYDLILVCTCFWPQTDQVYLFLAASLDINAQKLFIFGSTAIVTNCEGGYL